MSLVAAISSSRIIGFSNRLPWHLPEDLRHFRSKTINKTIIMGRKTFESIGRPLPKRRSIVITRRSNFSTPNVESATSLQDALGMCQGNSRVVVIGGGEIFREALPLADRINLTVVYLEDHQQSLFGPFLGDRFFPTISPKEWEIQHLGPRHRATNTRLNPSARSRHGYLNNVFYRFIDLVRVRAWSPPRQRDT
ncbi:MAG: dihydrofolate reductase, partial [Candidatus Acidiferrales bacterium]